MAITIKDVAKAAGVSTSTVSRIINKKGSFPEETRLRVQKIMSEMHYHPNSIARNFVRGSTNNIGLIINTEDSGTFFNEFFNKSVFGIETVAHAEGYSLLISGDRVFDNNVSAIEKLVYEKKVDGLIIPISIIKRKFITKLKNIGFPFIILGEPNVKAPDCSWIDVNNTDGGRFAVNHLYEKGYRRIAFISSDFDKTFNKNRLLGYRRGLEDNELPLNESFIRKGEMSIAGGFEQMNTLLKCGNPPDAVISSSCVMALGTLRAVRNAGLRVPEDIGVISFDNSPISEFAQPQLTTVDINTYELGAQAAQILIQNIHTKGGVCHHSLVTAKIIERQSTKKEIGV